MNLMTCNSRQSTSNSSGLAKGFTLVEVLMAMVILLFGLLAVVSMQIMAMRGNQHARETTERTTVADNVMEWLSGFGIDHYHLDIGTHVLEDDDGDGTYTITAPANPTPGDATDDNDPPADIIPPADKFRNSITSVSWAVTVNTHLDDVTDNNSYDAGETITSKQITVNVSWEGGGNTQISNIRNQI